MKRLVAVLAAATVALLPNAAAATPGPPGAPEWWFDTWRISSLWAQGADGRGITVAVIDTGVQADIPELQGKVLAGADFIGNGSDGRIDFDSEDFSHGTAMASIIVASSGYGDIAGLAPAAEILPIAVPLKGVIRKGGDPSVNATARAIRYAADHGAKVINMSLGGPRSQTDDELPCPQGIQDAVLHAIGRGALVLAASGNSGASGSPVEEPGVCLGVLSVGAVDAQLDVTGYSSRHRYLGVTAPGDNIPSLTRQPGTAFVGDGTSQATALASASIALIWSKYPHENAHQILNRLLTTAIDRGPKGRDPQYGFGVIDPAAAVAASPVAKTGSDPVLDAAAPLLARSRAMAAKPEPPAHASGPPASLGEYRVGAPPAISGTGFYLPAAGSALCAVLALGLLVAAVRSHRQPR